MLKKILQASLMMIVIVMAAVSGASAAEVKIQPGSIGVEKTFVKDDVKFEITIAQTTKAKDEILFKVNSKVTNVSKKPISYVINGCDAGIAASVITEGGSRLPLEEDYACPPYYGEKELKAGKSIDQERVFSMGTSSGNGLVPDQYNLRTIFMRGNMEGEQPLEFWTPFQTGVALSGDPIDLDVKLTKASSKYDMVVKGRTKADGIKAITLTIGTEKHKIRVKPKSDELYAKKNIKIKGAVPSSGQVEIEYKDGLKHIISIPVKVSPEK